MLQEYVNDFFYFVIWVFNVVFWKLVVKHGKKARVALEFLGK